MSGINKEEYKGITWINFDEYCKGCGICIERCPQKCLKFSKDRVGYYGTSSIECDIEKCIGCKVCDINCPDSAIKVEGKAKK